MPSASVDMAASRRCASFKLDSMVEVGIPPLTLGWRMQMAMAYSGYSIEHMAATCQVGRSTVSRWLWRKWRDWTVDQGRTLTQDGRMSNGEELLTATQVGYILRCSSRTVARMAQRGELEYEQKLAKRNGAYLFRRDKIEAAAAAIDAEPSGVAS